MHILPMPKLSNPIWSDIWPF